MKISKSSIAKISAIEYKILRLCINSELWGGTIIDKVGGKLQNIERLKKIGALVLNIRIYTDPTDGSISPEYHLFTTTFKGLWLIYLYERVNHIKGTPSFSVNNC